jgi:hypothetical protein
METITIIHKDNLKDWEREQMLEWEKVINQEDMSNWMVKITAELLDL